jgi:hypothetical protein
LRIDFVHAIRSFPIPIEHTPVLTDKLASAPL